MTDKTKKPPLGIMPREIYEEQRLAAIKGAIARYIQVDARIPAAWVEEYNDLLDRKRRTDT